MGVFDVDACLLVHRCPAYVHVIWRGCVSSDDLDPRCMSTHSYHRPMVLQHQTLVLN